MPREKEDFRDNLERIDKAFPGREYLSRRDVADFTGLNYYSIGKYFTLKSGMISKVRLAKEMS